MKLSKETEAIKHVKFAEEGLYHLLKLDGY
jgi:hypothetical protein